MRLEEISWKQAERYFERKDIAVIPVGSIENHGSQLALGTDYLIPKKLTEWVERELDVLILPGVPYGVANHHQGFPGTISLGEEGLYLVMSKIVWALYEYGIRKFVFLNGHGGNDGVLNKIGLEIEDNGGISALFNWWQIAGELNPAWKGGHGGGEETAAMLAIDEKYVHMEDYMPLVPNDLSENLPVSSVKTVRFKGVDVIIPRHFQSVTESGWFGPDDPRDATVSWGNEMLDATGKYLCEFIAEFEKVELPNL